MYELEKWIGEKVNTTGSYSPIERCLELYKRDGNHSIKLYKFKSRFNDEYYISDSAVIEKIEEFLINDNKKLYEYLYQLVIDKFGMFEFLSNIHNKILSERNEGYLKGKQSIQKELRSLLGIQ